MFGAAVLLEDTFSQMWELRESRDENWVGILDLAQTVLKALAKSEIESATPDQCWHLLQLVELHLSPSTKTVEDLDAAVRLVTDLNLTPYEGLEPLADA